MRRLLISLAATAALAAPQSVAAATKNVSISGTAFSPSSVTILTGDKVTWKNSDTKQHQVVSNSGAFASPILGASKSWTFTFTRTGTYRYHDGLHPSLKASVVVKARPIAPAVSLSLSHRAVVYGEQTMLSGTVSSGKANESVTVFVRESGQLSYVQAATVLTGAGGFWSWATTPRILTAYQVHYKNAVSAEAFVQVRPKIQLLGSRSYFTIRVLGAHSFAGRYVVLQRRTASGAWAGVARYKLGPRSGKLLRVPHRRGTSVYRAYMTAKQAGTGYLQGFSGMQRVFRRR